MFIAHSCWFKCLVRTHTHKHACALYLAIRPPCKFLTGKSKDIHQARLLCTLSHQTWTFCNAVTKLSAIGEALFKSRTPRWAWRVQASRGVLSKARLSCAHHTSVKILAGLPQDISLKLGAQIRADQSA